MAIIFCIICNPERRIIGIGNDLVSASLFGWSAPYPACDGTAVQARLFRRRKAQGHVLRALLHLPGHRNDDDAEVGLAGGGDRYCVHNNTGHHEPGCCR